MTLKTILIPLDGSDLSEQALDAALPLAEAFGAEILFLGVIDLTAGMYDVYAEAFNPVDLKAQLESFLETALDRAKARAEARGARARRFLRVGVPHDEIARLAEEEGADLVVMTTHGRKGLSHLLLGSVTEKVIRTAPCPVLVVRPKGAEEVA
ncbi:MAG: universal stress protein [Deferrisomatales bacterium]